MMDTILSLFGLMVVAITVENAVFSRGLGTNTVLNIDTTYSNIIAFGAGTTAVILASSVLAWFCDLVLWQYSFPLYVRSIAYLLCIAATYLTTHFVLLNKFPKFFKRYMSAISLASFSTVVFATILLCSMYKLDFLEVVFYSIGSGIGYTLAMLTVYIGKEQMKFLNIPKAFKGLPITLVYIGLISLSIYGMIGHQLPS